MEAPMTNEYPLGPATDSASSLHGKHGGRMAACVA